MKITIDPVNKMLSKLNIPLFVGGLLDSLVMAFQMFMVWFYIGSVAVE